VTITDVLVATVLILLIATFSLAAANHQKDVANLVSCASHLHQIGLALFQYAGDNNGDFPRGLYDIATADKPVAFTHVDAKAGSDEKCDAMYSKSGPGPNDVTAGPFRLIQLKLADPKLFLCLAVELPATQPAIKLDPSNQSNFTDLTQFNYSFANPYPNQDAATAGYELHAPFKPDFALAADLNPGVDALTKTGPMASKEEIKTINSPNHQGYGQNILFGDDHVEVDTRPFCSGPHHDNIYTFGAGNGAGIIGSPDGPEDSILLPTANQK
jgi:hypothetical protein